MSPPPHITAGSTLLVYAPVRLSRLPQRPGHRPAGQGNPVTAVTAVIAERIWGHKLGEDSAPSFSSSPFLPQMSKPSTHRGCHALIQTRPHNREARGPIQPTSDGYRKQAGIHRRTKRPPGCNGAVPGSGGTKAHQGSLGAPLAQRSSVASAQRSSVVHARVGEEAEHRASDRSFHQFSGLCHAISIGEGGSSSVRLHCALLAPPWLPGRAPLPPYQGVGIFGSA